MSYIPFREKKKCLEMRGILVMDVIFPEEKGKESFSIANFTVLLVEYATLILQSKIVFSGI